VKLKSRCVRGGTGGGGGEKGCEPGGVTISIFSFWQGGEKKVKKRREGKKGEESEVRLKKGHFVGSGEKEKGKRTSEKLFLTLSSRKEKKDEKKKNTPTVVTTDKKERWGTHGLKKKRRRQGAFFFSAMKKKKREGKKRETEVTSKDADLPTRKRKKGGEKKNKQTDDLSLSITSGRKQKEKKGEKRKDEHRDGIDNPLYPGEQEKRKRSRPISSIWLSKGKER